MDPPSSFCRRMLSDEYYVRQTLRPFLEKYTDSLPREIGKNGSVLLSGLRRKANFSYLRQEDGKRVLICPFVSEWLYAISPAHGVVMMIIRQLAILEAVGAWL